MRLIVRTRNRSCAPLREINVQHPTILRMGSTTPTEAIRIRHSNEVPIELNTAEACRISGDKILMKKAFAEADIPTAEYFLMQEIDPEVIASHLTEWKKIIVKRVNSSKGKGIYLIENEEDMNKFFSQLEDNGDSVRKYVFERYYTYSREYRLHVTKDGCFYACRKMLKNDAEVRWHRHAENSVWINEDNPLFSKPDNWDKIIEDCISALKAIGLDIAAFDVKVQNSATPHPKYIILESNSAPALGEVGLEKYKSLLNGKF